MNKKTITIKDFQIIKNTNNKISMVAAYDYTSASIINNSNVMSVLVGDSAAMTMAGFQNTLNANIEMLSYHTSSVARGAPGKFIVADMPFLSFRKDRTTTITNVETLIKSGAHAIKIEGVDGNETTIEHIIQSGIPVMGHIGLTPQSINTLGGFKVQGRGQQQATMLINQAKKLQKLGCFAIVIECVPAITSKEITNILDIPTIGIGAGPDTDGQVLVWHDMMGLTDFESLGVTPKFIKKYSNARDMFTDNLNMYHSEIQNDTFPDLEHCYQ